MSEAPRPLQSPERASVKITGQDLFQKDKEGNLVNPRPGLYSTRSVREEKVLVQESKRSKTLPPPPPEALLRRPSQKPEQQNPVAETSSIIVDMDAVAPASDPTLADPSPEARKKVTEQISIKGRSKKDDLREQGMSKLKTTEKERRRKDLPPSIQDLADRIDHLEEQIYRLGKDHSDLKGKLQDRLEEHRQALLTAINKHDERSSEKKYVPPQAVYRDLRTPLPSANKGVSGIFEKARSAATTAKTWLKNLFQQKPANDNGQEGGLGLGEVVRNLEAAEQENRDLPTMLLTKKRLDGTPLSEAEKRSYLDTFDNHLTVISDADRLPRNIPGAVRSRTTKVITEGLPIYDLARAKESPAAYFEDDTDTQEAWATLKTEIPAYIQALKRNAEAGPTKAKQESAKEALQKLKRSVGGVTTEQITQRTLLTLEAASRIQFMEMTDIPHTRLQEIYQRRTKEIESILNPKGALKEALQTVNQNINTVDLKKRAA